MDMLKHLNDAVAYIEDHLDEELCMDALARIACVSADGFSRYFSYMTGVTIHEYIRRRRLTLAAYDLRQSGAKVLDVALKAGYNSADAFTKAFVRQHGISPKEARNPACPLKVYPPVSFHIIIKGAKEMDYRLIETDAIEVYGVSRQLSASERFEARNTMWDEKKDYLPLNVSAEWEGVWYGIWDAGKYAIAREKADATGKNLEDSVIPAGLYAAFRTERGGRAEEELRKLHDLIFDSWLPDSGYEQTADFEVEVYHLFSDREVRRKNRYYEIWIPVRRLPAV